MNEQRNKGKDDVTTNNIACCLCNYWTKCPSKQIKLLIFLKCAANDRLKDVTSRNMKNSRPPLEICLS